MASNNGVTRERIKEVLLQTAESKFCGRGRKKEYSRKNYDHLNAVLIVVRLEAQRIRDLVESDSSSQSGSEIKTRALSVIKLTLDLYEEARSIVRRLRPEVIDTLGLRDAVEEMVRHYDALQSQCRFEFQSEGSMFSLKGELAITAYRLIQEALSNVIKHSAATKAMVHVQL